MRRKTGFILRILWTLYYISSCLYELYLCLFRPLNQTTMEKTSYAEMIDVDVKMMLRRNLSREIKLQEY